MKQMKLNKLLIPAIVLNLAAVGCQSKHPQNVTDLPQGGPNAVVGDAGTSGSDSSGSLTNANWNPGSEYNGTPITPPTALDGYAHDTEIFKSDVVHFAYDSSSIKEDERSKASQVAAYLKSNPADAVEVDGHCDERGTEEYNRSLGERRALAIREELMRQGIEASKVVTLSYGKDRPASSGHDEASWKENRRGEFVLLTPPAAKLQ